jgi:hypothetical protein
VSKGLASPTRGTGLSTESLGLEQFVVFERTKREEARMDRGAESRTGARMIEDYDDNTRKFHSAHAKSSAAPRGARGRHSGSLWLKVVQFRLSEEKCVIHAQRASLQVVIPPSTHARIEWGRGASAPAQKLQGGKSSRAR